MKSIIFVAFLAAASAFAPFLQCPRVCSPTALRMANEKDLIRWSKSKRTAGVDDRVVELKRPLGLVLEEDDKGNVYVETVAPKGNAARTGLVRPPSLFLRTHCFSPAPPLFR